MAEKAVGSIVLSLDGQEYDCTSLNVNEAINRKPIPTMNRRRRINFVASGIRTYELTCSVVIPDGKDSIDWAEVEDVRISVESPTGNFRETYTDCGVTSIGSAYDVNGETKRDLTLYACDKINESM